MIGSFWNLCRACPSMPVDKLHSEYRSTYRWHEYTGPRQEVVRRPPQPSGGNGSGKSQAAMMNQGSEEETSGHVDGSGSPSAAVGSALEPAMPRKKKHPELAYKTHEFLAMSDGGSDDSLDSTISFDRARSEERTGRRFRPSRRSKSEGPPTRDFPFQSEYRLQYGKLLAERQAYQDQQLPPSATGVNNQKNDDWEDDMMTASFPPPAPPATIKTRISTEYRLQFAWPRAAEILARKAEETRNTVAVAAAGGPPRKSLSMGAIRPTSHLVPVHKKRTEEPEGAPELEPLVGSEDAHDNLTNMESGELRGEEKIQEEIFSKEEKHRRRKEFKTEYKKRFRPFSQYEYTEGRFTKRKEGDVVDTSVPVIPLTVPLADLTPQSGDSWYHEVLELRKKAGEYKHRGWGTELVPQHIAELYNKQMTLWDQVSRRSSLAALSLASTSPRSITKEEKERENSKKSSPTKSCQSNRMIPTSGRADDRVDSVERKKLDKDSDKKEVPRSRKEFLIRHHLERTTGAVDGALLPSPTREKLEPVIPRRKDEDISIKSPPKSSPKSSPRSARSQSVGPISENRSSPKRQPRAPSVAPAGAQNASSTIGSPAGAKTHPNGPVHTERRPRPIAVGERAWCSRLQKSPPRRVFSPSNMVSTASYAASPSLSTAPSRSKSSSLAMRNEEGKPHHAMKPKHNLPTTAPTGKAVNGLPHAGKVKGDRTKTVAEKKDTNADVPDTSAVTQQEPPPAVHTQKPTPTAVEPSEDKQGTPSDVSPQVTPAAAVVQQPSSLDQPRAYIEAECEQIVKSPPEPTRVKSPEQILMRSPEPVNWTVPLDTGKTFTVTQNVRDGELSRPHSETKQWGASSTDQDHSGVDIEDQAPSAGGYTEVEPGPVAGWKSPSSDPMTTSVMGSFSTVNGLEDKSEESQASQETKSPAPQSSSKQPASSTPVSYEKAVAGTTLKCLDDPSFDSPSAYPISGAQASSSSKPESSGSPYRVLEAPSDVGDVPLSASRPTSTPYRILEAPDSPMESPTKGAAPMMSPSSNRSLASDVLEKARTRFDKFWGKGKDEKEGKV